MCLDLKKYKLSTVQYAITKCDIIAPKLKENYSVPIVNIQNFVIDNNYEEYYYPFFQINMYLPSNVQRLIKETPLEIYIDIEIEARYYSDRTGQSIEHDSISKFVAGKYIAYMENQTRSILDSEKEDYEDSQGYNLKSTSMEMNEVCSFTLYNDKIMNGLSTNINDIISSTNLLNALGYVLTRAGMSNVLLSPPNNNKVYKPFILPPKDAESHLEMICHDYGLHSHGTLIYHGLDRTYIIDKQPKCTAYSVNEYQTTYLYHPGGSKLVISTGCAKSSAEKANMILIQPSTFKFTDLSVPASKSMSNDVIALDPFGRCGSGGSSADYTMMIGGDDISSAIESSTKAYTKTVHMGFVAVDLNMLTPNKKFTIILDDVKYKAYTGDFMLSTCNTIFTRNGRLFSAITTCSFKA